MSTTTMPGAYAPVSPEAMIDALALLDAYDTVLADWNGGTGSRLSGVFDPHWSRLRSQAFGPHPESEEEYACDPIVLEIDVRGQEYAADALEEVGMQRMARDRREYARQMREAGSVELIFTKSIENDLVEHTKRKIATLEAENEQLRRQIASVRQDSDA